MVVVVVGSLRTTCSNEDYCSPVLCLGAKQRTPSPSSVAFYDMPGKDWAVCIFFIPVHTRGKSSTQSFIRFKNTHHFKTIHVPYYRESYMYGE